MWAIPEPVIKPKGCRTVVGNDLFTCFRSTDPESRADFIECPRAGDLTCTVNGLALEWEYMARMKPPATAIARLAGHPRRRFIDGDAWKARLAGLGIGQTALKPDLVKIATEPALQGGIRDAGRLADTVTLSDGAGNLSGGSSWTADGRFRFGWKAGYGSLNGGADRETGFVRGLGECGRECGDSERGTMYARTCRAESVCLSVRGCLSLPVKGSKRCNIMTPSASFRRGQC